MFLACPIWLRSCLKKSHLETEIRKNHTIVIFWELIMMKWWSFARNYFPQAHSHSSPTFRWNFRLVQQILSSARGVSYFAKIYSSIYTTQCLYSVFLLSSHHHLHVLMFFCTDHKRYRWIANNGAHVFVLLNFYYLLFAPRLNMTKCNDPSQQASNAVPSIIHIRII